jgi:hypothetical protein
LYEVFGTVRCTAFKDPSVGHRVKVSGDGAVDYGQSPENQFYTPFFL